MPHMHQDEPGRHLGLVTSGLPKLSGTPHENAQVALKERTAPLKHICHLLNVDPGGKEELNIKCVYQRLSAGTPIYQSGNPFLGIYVIAAGTAKECVVLDDEEIVAALFFPGEIIGLKGIDGFVHTSNAVAVSELLLIWIPYEGLKRYCKKYKDIEASILRAFAQQIFDATVLIKVLARGNSSAKLAFFLVSLAMRTGAQHAPATELRVALPRRDIAIYLGMAYETLSRNLGDLAEKKLIRCEGNIIYIEDMENLQQICFPYALYLDKRR